MPRAIEENRRQRRVVKTGKGPRKRGHGSMMQGGMLSCIFLMEQEKNASQAVTCVFGARWTPCPDLSTSVLEDQREEVVIPPT
jgi:hypothetical protein